MPELPEVLAWCPDIECGSDRIECLDFYLPYPLRRVWQMELRCQECRMEWAVQCPDQAKNEFFERYGQRRQVEIAVLELLFHSSPDS